MQVPTHATVTVSLAITYRRDGTQTSPEQWDWPTLLDLGPDEHVEVVDAQPGTATPPASGQADNS